MAPMHATPLRYRTWRRRELLDRWLAAGAAPHVSDELALRARVLCQARARRELADGLDAAARTGCAPHGPVDGDAVRKAQRRLLELAARVRAEEPDPRVVATARLLLSGQERRETTRSATTRPMASEAVAAGDGALRTWSARSVSEKAKSSSRAPSRPTAWARVPAK
jgi:hypothetical protein